MSSQTPGGDPPPDPAATPGEPAGPVGPVGPDPDADTARLPWDAASPPPQPPVPPASDGWTRPEPAPAPAAAPPPPPPPPGSTGPAFLWATPSAAVVAEVPGAPGLRFADTTSRFVAYVLDSFIVAIIATIVGGILGLNETVVTRTGTNVGAYTSLTGAAFSIVFTVVALVYFVLFWSGGRRATPAQRLFNLQVGNAFDGAPLTLTQALKRWLALGDIILLLGVVPALVSLGSLVSFVWAIVLFITTVRSPTKQGLHDRFANSAMVRPLSAGAAGGLAKACLVIVGILFALFVFLIVALIFLGNQVSEILSRVGSSV